jgi:hypothetical protein
MGVEGGGVEGAALGIGGGGAIEGVGGRKGETAAPFSEDGAAEAEAVFGTTGTSLEDGGRLEEPVLAEGFLLSAD